MTVSKARGFWTYRGFKRNKAFGRKPIGNTKPNERATARLVLETAERIGRERKGNRP